MTSLSDIGNLNGSSDAVSRWATFGPYYAMFPIEFAFQIIDKYSKPGDYVLDPFAGRFSAVYAAAALGRHATGIEINPVGWLYGKTKLSPAKKDAVLFRLKEICSLAGEFEKEARQLEEFFHYCYAPKVRTFLLAAKHALKWRSNGVDATLMSIILVNLHGKKGEGLSNQMRQTKAMSAPYSIEWWKNNGYCIPPEYDPLDFLTQKIEWRYKKGVPRVNALHREILGESTSKLLGVARDAEKRNVQYSLLFTSPPYQGVVDYHADQWLRLWMLNQKRTEGKYTRRFNSKEEYAELLDLVFERSARILKAKATVVVRTDVRSFTLDTTLQALSKYFPKHSIRQTESSVSGISQTELFNNRSKKKEVDIVLTR